MIIEDNRVKQIQPFIHIKPGELFAYPELTDQARVYLKIHDIVSEAKLINAVDLETGHPANYMPNTMVRSINGRVLLED